MSGLAQKNQIPGQSLASGSGIGLHPNTMCVNGILFCGAHSPDKRSAACLSRTSVTVRFTGATLFFQQCFVLINAQGSCDFMLSKVLSHSIFPTKFHPGATFLPEVNLSTCRPARNITCFAPAKLTSAIMSGGQILLRVQRIPREFTFTVVNMKCWLV